MSVGYIESLILVQSCGTYVLVDVDDYLYADLYLDTVLYTYESVAIIGGC